MSQDESKKPEPFLPEEVKDFDSLVEWLRWKGEPSKAHFEPPKFWPHSRLLRTHYCKAAGCTRWHDASSAAKAAASLCLILSILSIKRSYDLLIRPSWFGAVFLVTVIMLARITWHLAFFLGRKYGWKCHENVLNERRAVIVNKKCEALIATHITDSIGKSVEETVEPMEAQAKAREERLVKFGT